MARKKKPASRRASTRESSAKRATARARSKRAAAKPPMTSTPVFEAFAVGLKPATLKTQRALARSIARAAIPSGATVEFLQRDRSTGSAPRDVAVTPSANIKISTGAAWERARAILNTKGVRYAEPLFRGPGMEPEPAKTGKLLAPHERVGRVPRTRSLGGDKVLPCAQNVLWSIEMIRAPEAWALAPPAGGVQFGEGIVIGHPDTGYRPHEEIWHQTPAQRRVRPGDGYDFEDRDPDPLDPLKKSDSHGHGTATASVIMSARAAAQERTVVGTAPSAQLVPLRVSDSVVHFSFKNVTQAIYHAVDRANAHVISMSLGGPFFSDALEAAIDHAISKGVIVLAAAGNVWPFVVYPARFDQVIAVAACNCNRQPWSKSASGSAVDITAPGESVWRALSTKNGGTVVYSIEPSSGTSYAVAHIAGACATWLAFHGRNALINKYGAGKLAGVFRTLLTTAGFTRPAGWKTGDYGAGIVDVAKLLGAALPPSVKMTTRSLFPQRVRAEDTVDRVAGYFPDLSRAQVRAVLAESFEPQKRGAQRSAALEDLGPELAFHVASNADLRARIHARALAPKSKKRTRSVGVASGAANPLAPAKDKASPALRRAIG
jgi:subtilisin family serine protease